MKDVAFVVLVVALFLCLLAAVWTSGMKYGFVTARAEFAAANCGPKKRR